jgi:hypothetical protein
MLGVHRPGVSVVAALFQQAGIIQYSRGHKKYWTGQGWKKGRANVMSR